MANDLTGDYDVVAEFALPAVNRILAGMHRGKRLPHAMSMAVDDTPNAPLGVTAVPVGDIYGTAIADASSVKQSAYASLTTSAQLSRQAVLRNVDPAVNWRPEPRTGRGQGGALPGTGIEAASGFLSGVALLQLGAPTMQLPAGRSDRADVHTPAMIRYVGDKHSRPLPGFLRGEIITSFGVRQAASRAGTNIVVDLAGPAGSVHFIPVFAANNLSEDDRAAIDKVMSKSLKESFQPSSTPLPSKVREMHFKGFAEEGAVAVLMNVTTDNHPSPDSVRKGFLRPEDHFALAVNGDSITRPIAAAVNSAIGPRQQKTDNKVAFSYGIGTKTFHIFSTVTVLNATVELVNIPQVPFSGAPGTGQIRLTIPVQVRFGWEGKPVVVPDPVDFDFKILQVFTLTLNGRQVGLQRLGDVIVDIPGNVPDNEKNPARDQARTLFNKAWNSQEKQIQDQIDKALNAEGLRAFVKSLMNSKAHVPTSPQVEEVDPVLAYTSFEIRPAGIILHGALALPPWPAPHVEFDKDPRAPASAPEYRALTSWIPGGTIQEYQWGFSEGGRATDANRFVTVNAPALATVSNRISLSFTGSRITASGPVSTERVDSPRVSSLVTIPMAKYTGLRQVAAGSQPHVAVPKSGSISGHTLDVVAHVSPWAPDGLAGATANFVIHFPDERSAGHLELLPQALAQSGHTDTATAILAVLTPRQLPAVRTVNGLLYADDSAAWENLLGIHGRPATVILNPSGRVAWRHEGGIGGGELAEALRTHLAAGGKFFPQFVKTSLRVGERSPNFVFDSEPGVRLTLRDLAGRAVVLVFWRSTSAPSIAVLRNLHRAFTQPEVDAPLVVAINDGGSGLAAGEAGAVVVVPDPARQIARAYGISLWPTLVFLDAVGVVRDIRFGLLTEEELETSVRSRTVPSGYPGKEY